jgi:hypothetical protein
VAGAVAEAEADAGVWSSERRRWRSTFPERLLRREEEVSERAEEGVDSERVLEPEGERGVRALWLGEEGECVGERGW